MLRIEPIEPILCAPLLRRVDEHLLDLLRALSPDEWDLQTVAPAWKVRDVAAHLLDTALRKLSLVRDGWVVDKTEITSPADVVTLVNRLNREGVTIYRRLSPAILIELMSLACRRSAEFHEALDPFAEATFSVSWAGESRSLNWFDTARELTERWHHQQQIRLATDRPGIMAPELYHPVLDCFVRGLPFAYRAVDAAEGQIVALEIAGDCGGRWWLARQESGWTLTKSEIGPAAVTVTIPQEIAWRVFTRGIARAEALALSSVEGDLALGLPVFELTAVVA
jgi:uncharacterized protein (TIGR03083 family)